MAALSKTRRIYKEVAGMVGIGTMKKLLPDSSQREFIYMGGTRKCERAQLSHEMKLSPKNILLI